jgi:hypothetical protein
MTLSYMNIEVNYYRSVVSQEHLLCHASLSNNNVRQKLKKNMEFGGHRKISNFGCESLWDRSCFSRDSRPLTSHQITSSSIREPFKISNTVERRCGVFVYQKLWEDSTMRVDY